MSFIPAVLRQTSTTVSDAILNHRCPRRQVLLHVCHIMQLLREPMSFPSSTPHLDSCYSRSVRLIVVFVGFSRHETVTVCHVTKGAGAFRRSIRRVLLPEASA